MNKETVRGIIDAIYDVASWNDGLVTFPAYKLEQLQNEAFPDSQFHDFTEEQ